jgi:hypothetical protein
MVVWIRFYGAKVIPETHCCPQLDIYVFILFVVVTIQSFLLRWWHITENYGMGGTASTISGAEMASPSGTPSFSGVHDTTPNNILERFRGNSYIMYNWNKIKPLKAEFKWQTLLHLKIELQDGYHQWGKRAVYHYGAH